MRDTKGDVDEIKNILEKQNNNYNNDFNYYNLTINDLDDKKFSNILERLSWLKPTDIYENKIYKNKNEILYSFRDGTMKMERIKKLQYNKINNNIDLLLFSRTNIPIDNFLCNTNYDYIYKQQNIIFICESNIKINLTIQIDEEKNQLYNCYIEFRNNTDFDILKKYYYIIVNR